MRVYIICDLEGTAGVVDFKQQCAFRGEYYLQARQWATAELSAAVEGALAGGATEIVAWDGHGGFPGGLDVGALHSQCELVMGAGDGGPAGLNDTFDAMLLIGFHGMAGAKNGVLAHSFTPFIETMWLNGEPVGEIGMNINLAGSWGVPCLLISGDQAAAEEAQALVPGIETAVVKRGLRTQQQPCGTVPMLTQTPEAACRKIRQAAERAMGRLSEIEPFTFEPPYIVRTRYRSPVIKYPAERPYQTAKIDDYTLEADFGDKLQPLI